MSRAIGAGLALCCLLVPVASGGHCSCHRPEKADGTRWGGNQAVVLVPKEHFREVKGIVTIGGKNVDGALIEIFDQPGYLIDGRPWKERPAQKRIKACVTSADGKFCFKGLPAGDYELRVSKDQGWDVTHVYVVVTSKDGSDKTLEVTMQLGT